MKEQQSNGILDMIYKLSQACSFQLDYQINVYYYVSEKDRKTERQEERKTGRKKERKKERKKDQKSNGKMDMILYVKCVLSTWLSNKRVLFCYRERQNERKKDHQSNGILDIIYNPSQVCSFILIIK